MSQSKLTFTGKVVSRMAGQGSKSEHEAVVLETSKKDYVLRMKGGNPFYNPELNKLVGKTIRATGELADYVFFVEDWEETDG
jgi:spore coat polysaccharide biosynthesis protein SpsF (cytidylyltransferase family)